MRSKVTEINLLEGLDLNWMKKEWVNLKTGKLRLSSMRNNKKKEKGQSLRPVVHDCVNTLIMRALKVEGREKRAERVLEVIMFQPPKFDNINLYIQEA